MSQITDAFQPLSKIRGSYLFREGDPVTHIYLIVDGLCTITKKVYYDKPDIME